MMRRSRVGAVGVGVGEVGGAGAGGSRNSSKIVSAVDSCSALRVRKSSTGRDSTERIVVRPRPLC